MSFSDSLHKKLIVISYHLTSEQIIESRQYRNWELYDKLSDIEKMQQQLEELSIFEELLDNITDDTISNVMSIIYNSRFV